MAFSIKQTEPQWTNRGFGAGIQGFQNLMRHRIRNILLVSSLYDLYVFEEDGRLYELIRDEYRGLNLSHSPEITRVSGGKEAIEIAKEERRFDLIITTQRIEDVSVIDFPDMVRSSGLDIPVVLLAYDNRELNELLTHYDLSIFDKIFIWTGDFRLIIGIIKYLEDRINVQHDTSSIGVQVIILIEDSIRFYSSYLPLLYTEILKQAQILISEGLNLSHKYLRMRARPKILLCATFEEAWDYFEQYEEYILGIISDIDFKRNDKSDPEAGLIFAKNVKKLRPDIPILLQSTDTSKRDKTHKLGASFAVKDSPTLLQELSLFTRERFGFGDFTFRDKKGIVVATAHDLKSLEKHLKTVPGESVEYHASHNHFSNWLKARTEFGLAHKLRPRKVSDYPSIENLRSDLVSSLREYRKLQRRGIIIDFKKETFDPESGFARIGGGSLGGKARGLSFLNMLLSNYSLQNQFDGVQIIVPPGIFLGTDVFDAFIDGNDLRNFALNAVDDHEIVKIFSEAPYFPEDTIDELTYYLEFVSAPLAVRSSSLLEDSQYHPFAGVYDTYMIPNNNKNIEKRTGELLLAIKRVYASVFYQSTKDYIKMTSYRLEEEKMAIIIQKMVGARYANCFYPAFAGVAKSYNFYPVPPQKSSDGIVDVALGLGKTVVEGDNSVRFSPKYPNHLPQFFSTKETLRNNQRHFYALDLSAEIDDPAEIHDVAVKKYSLKDAEKDNTLYYVGSTYIHENDTIYDGLSRSGPRIVSFAPVLKHQVFPLPDIIDLLLAVGSWGMGSPIEIEFAVNMDVKRGRPKNFGLLQMRPLVLDRERELLSFDNVKSDSVLCHSPKTLGNGITNDIYDIIYVDSQLFERSKSREIAEEVSAFNHKLVSTHRPYLLIGVGRWGTLDPWLGIPVKWDQIAGAKAIVETGFKDFMVTPSQGSHFFQNITSFMISYFTVNAFKDEGFMDWEWLLKQPPAEERAYTRHIRFDKPLVIKINGQTNEGVILKPSY